MKKWITSILVVVFTAGISVADGSSPWWKFGFGGNDDKQLQAEQGTQENSSKQKDRRRPQISKEQRANMRAEYEAIQKTAEMARSETDPVKKEELTNQLRAKLTENAKKSQEQYRRRIEKAEKELTEMKERLNKREADLEKRVEEHLQKLLAGEKVGRKGDQKSGQQDGMHRKGGPPQE